MQRVGATAAFTATNSQTSVVVFHQGGGNGGGRGGENGDVLGFGLWRVSYPNCPQGEVHLGAAEWPSKAQSTYPWFLHMAYS